MTVQGHVFYALRPGDETSSERENSVRDHRDAARDSSPDLSAKSAKSVLRPEFPVKGRRQLPMAPPPSLEAA